VYPIVISISKVIAQDVDVNWCLLRPSLYQGLRHGRHEQSLLGHRKFRINEGAEVQVYCNG